MCEREREREHECTSLCMLPLHVHLHEVTTHKTYPDSDNCESNSHGEKYETDDDETNAHMSGTEHRTTGWDLLLKPFITYSHKPNK